MLLAPSELAPGALVVFLAFVFCLGPASSWHTRCHHACVFVFPLFFGAVFGVLVFCVLFGVLDDRDSTQDYVSVLHQFTFCGHSTATAYA